MATPIRTLLSITALTVLLVGCASKPAAPAEPAKPIWQMTIDSNPPNAIIQGNWTKEDGSTTFKQIGVTPYSLQWRQAYSDETIKITMGNKTATVIPQEGRSIFIDFEADPITVTGATLVHATK
jgi:PBP1b-binding outer membrane lipoprotein LpoB